MNIGQMLFWIFYTRLLLNHTMSYAQRFIVGIILIISAYELLEGASERHHFHLIISHISKTFNTCLGCYTCVEFYRKALAVFIFTGGFSLISEHGIVLPIISQVFLLLLSMVSTTRGTELNTLHWIAVHIALLIVLIINYKQLQQESKQAEIAANNAAKAVQPVVVEDPKPKKVNEAQKSAESKAENLKKQEKVIDSKHKKPQRK